MITHAIYGGLGNQLYQIFTVVALSLKSGHDFYFEYKPDVATAENIQRTTYWDSFFKKLSPYLKTSEECRAIEEHLGVMEIHEPSNAYHSNLFDEVFHVPKNSKVIRLNGYFQSYKYFESVFADIYQMIGIDKLTQKFIKSMYAAHDMWEYGMLCDVTERYEQVISMHFRIGDYKDLQHTHPILPLQYYSDALKEALGTLTYAYHLPVYVLYFCEKHDKAVVDDYYIAKLKEKFPQCVFVPIHADLCDWKQLLFMSICNYNIIANSTFSLWGAWLNYKSRTACYPDMWFTLDGDYTWVVHFDDDMKHLLCFLPCSWTTKNKSLTSRDMFPPHWKKIRVGEK